MGLLKSRLSALKMPLKLPESAQAPSKSSEMTLLRGSETPI
jgi:hypothetical protein